MPIHRELSGEQIHAPYTWEFADETARTSETITDATLEGRLAWQKSDDTVWLLTGTSPASWWNISLSEIKADKSNVLELDNLTEFTPSGSYNPATKKYVDDNAGGAGAGASVIEVQVFS